MGIKSTITDGNGTDLTAQVSESDNKGLKSKNLHVTIASVEPGFSLPTQLGISGEVFDELLVDSGGSEDMTIDGSTTPVEYSIGSDDEFDIILSSLTIFSSDNGVKLETFMGLNSALTNGIDLEIKADDNLITYRPMVTTNSFIKFASVGGVEFFTSQSGDSVKATIVFEPAIPIRKTGTFGAGADDDDYIKLTINDNVTQVTVLEAFARGAKAEAGTL